MSTRQNLVLHSTHVAGFCCLVGDALLLHRLVCENNPMQSLPSGACVGHALRSNTSYTPVTA